MNKLTDYGVPEGNILGIRYGFRGFYDRVSLGRVGILSRRLLLSILQEQWCCWTVCGCSRHAAAPWPWHGIRAHTAHVDERCVCDVLLLQENKPVVLTKQSVDGIQLQGGTILGTSRGGANMK